MVRKKSGGRARAVTPSAEARGLAARGLAMDDPDYAYACERRTDDAAGRPAEQWA